MKNRFKFDVQKYLALCCLLVLVVFFSIFTETFLSTDNVISVVLSTCVNGLLALGITFCVITGSINISVGTMMTMSSVMIGVALVNWQLSLPVALLIGILTAVFFGLGNGFMITYMKLPPYIATMGTMMVCKGLALVITEGKPIYLSGNAAFSQIALGSIFGEGSRFYNAMLIFIIMCLISYVILSKTIIGRNMYAVGSNMEAARLSGIRVYFWKILAHVLCAIYCAIAAIVMSSRLNAAQPAVGAGYEGEALCAAVIGGASLSGGYGKVTGTIIGAFVMSVLTNGLRLMSVKQEWQQVAIGLVLIFAVFSDVISRRKKESK